MDHSRKMTPLRRGFFDAQMAPSTFSTTKKERFLAALATGLSISGACEAAHIPRRTAYNHRDTDVDFKDAWDAAVIAGVEHLEDEARRRAVEGVDKPVYQGGARVGVIREYSDTLLIFLLKGRAREKYGDQVRIDFGAVRAEAERLAKEYDLDPEELIRVAQEITSGAKR